MNPTSNHLHNVIFNEDLKPWCPSDDAVYGIHFSALLKQMADYMGDSFWKYKFLYYEHRMRREYKCLGLTGDDVILVMVADEKSTVPDDICGHYFAVLKAFYPLEENKGNIISFPLGYSNSAPLTRFIPFEERDYDVSYAGNFLSNRLDFYRSFNCLKYLPPCQITSRGLRLAYFKALTKLKLYKPVTYRNRMGKSFFLFTGGFGKGLSRQEYADLLSNTRIALCPKGFITTSLTHRPQARPLATGSHHARSHDLPHPDQPRRAKRVYLFSVLKDQINYESRSITL